MQQLQKPVLNIIKPGQTPIFIISPNIIDGEPIAVLLSNHIQVHSSYKNTESHHHKKNYFQSEEIKKLSQEISGETTKSKEDYGTAFRFIFEKGFDSNSLWGLQIDYKLFFELQVDKLFSDAFFIFQYGTKLKRPEKKTIEEYSNNIISYCQNNPSNTYVFHINNAIYLPEIVLKSLNFDSNARIREHFNIDEILTERIKSEPYLFYNTEEATRLKKSLDKLNPLNDTVLWYTGEEPLFIITVTDSINHEVLLRKAEQFSRSFLNAPKIIIITKNEGDKRSVQSLFSHTNNNIPNITITSCHSNIATSVNEIISSSNYPYYVIDNLVQSYFITDLLLPLNASKRPAYIFSSSKSKKINEIAHEKLSVTDILTIPSIPENLAFARKTWEEIKGFDESFDRHTATWDFIIRSLEIKGNYALEIDGAIAGDDIDSKEISFESYLPILTKHKVVFEEQLRQIVKIFSENQYLPNAEIKKLNGKIVSVQSLLNHSKDEVTSLNRLTNELQQQIAIYEGRWHFKLANKFDRLRKIFFKKKAPGTSTLKKILKFIIFAFSKPGFNIVRKIFKGAFRRLYLITEDRQVQIVYLDNPKNSIYTYNDWIKNKLNHETLKTDYEIEFPLLKTTPRISIVMPVYNPSPNFLKQAIESVMNQSYQNWELCIADDKSPDPHIRKILEAYSLKNNRIKVVFREENGHISAASNSALALATGDYILFMDHDDLLTENCCFEVVKFIDKNPDKNDIIYSDEDKINGDTHLIPHFKPDWAPDNLLSRNYFGHVVVMKKYIVDQVKGFRLGFEGSQDYDLILRATELSSRIGHIPKVLYHWRIHEKSAAQSEEVKPYAYIAAKKALEEALVRRNTPGHVKYLSGLRGYQVVYDIVKPGKVSIIIPTKDHVKLLQNTIDSIYNKTSYKDYEVIVINNNSTTREFFELIAIYEKKYTNFKCIEANIPFNFSKLMNIGFSHCNGDYILLLNNDVEVIHDEWLTKMVSFAQYKQTGAIGAKLLYPDDNIQHAGVIIGLGGVAGHAFVNNYKDDAGYFNYIQSTNNYSAVTAACLMCRRDVYEEVGGMDETFEVEYNDVDFCLKIMDHGYYNVYLPEVELYHYESATRGHPHQSKESWERHIREVDMFKDKWEKYIKHDPYYNPNLNLGVHDFSMDFSK